MSNVIDFGEWKRARLGRHQGPPIKRRARAGGGRRRTPTSIGELSAELLRLLQTE
jgi:hypothetical protein